MANSGVCRVCPRWRFWKYSELKVVLFQSFCLRHTLPPNSNTILSTGSYIPTLSLSCNQWEELSIMIHEKACTITNGQINNVTCGESSDTHEPQTGQNKVLQVGMARKTIKKNVL